MIIYSPLQYETYFHFNLQLLIMSPISVYIQLPFRLVTDLELQSSDLCITHIHLLSAEGLVDLIRY